MIKLRTPSKDICLYLTIAKMVGVVVVCLMIYLVDVFLFSVLLLCVVIIFFFSSSFFVTLLLQREFSSEARSAPENQLERLTREKVRVYRIIFWG